MHVLIIGCGDTGAYLAQEYCKQDHNVTVIDKDDHAFAKLHDGFNGITICGDASDIYTLRHGFAASADEVLVVTGDDNVNVAVAQLIKSSFDVDKIVVRIKNAENETVFSHIDLNIICPAKLFYERISA